MVEQRRYEPRDLLGLNAVSDPQISPDGQRTAYVVTALNEEADKSSSTLWLATTDGDTRQITLGDSNASQPRWSPSGSHIAFLSNRAGGQSQLQVMPMDGGEARQVSDFPQGVSEFAWAPDGSTIAAVSKVGEPQEGDNRTPPRVINSLSYKFNGQGYFDDSRRHIFLLDLNEGQPMQLTDGDWNDGQIAWSPDGGSIVFVSARHESRDRDAAEDLWVVPASGGDPARLTERFGACAAPVFSPDGNSIAFCGHDYPDDPAARTTSIWLIPASGGEARNLTSPLDRSVQAGALAPGAPPARIFWTPDGGALLGRVHDGPNVHLYAFSAEDGSPSRLMEGERCVEALSVAPDGSVAALVSDPTHPAEVFRLDDVGRDVRVTATNDEWLAGLRFPETERVRVPLPDGESIEGWVIKPLDMEPGRQYPLVLDVHGGPHSAFQNSFKGSYPLILAGRGIGVLQMNPRGSTGWGEDFARYLGGGRGEKDFPELMTALEQVVSQGWVDADRLGITGYSYGGYMTAWAIGQTDRFKAAAWGAGVCDLYSHYAYTDNNVQRYTEMGGSPWELRDLYMRLSPLTYVDRVHTPLLMLHGEADMRCNTMQADQFFTALKYYGQDVTLVRYPGEHHGMRQQGRPSTRVDYDERVLAWFAERLGSA